MKSAAVLAAALLSLALPAWAQDEAGKVRLDDFALPADSAGPRIEQLGDTAESLRPAAAPADDRGVIVPGPPAAEAAPVSQLSQPGEDGRSPQLSERGESRQLAAGSVSSPDDSRPRATAPLGGSDRCDPQLASEQLERCQQVLERRAAEFDAPEAPRLSAEQVLLAQRGYDKELLAPTSSDLRLKLAADDPNAKIESNQELASIYLDRARPQSPAEPAAEDPALDAKLVEVLQGLQIDVTGPGAP